MVAFYGLGNGVLLRLGAAVPFIAGVVLVTAWLHVRYGALCGLLFLFLATASPLLLDLSRRAAAALGRLPRRPTVPAAAAFVMLLVVASAGVPFLVAIPREPREALREVQACSQAETTVLVVQIWLLDAISVPCPEREGIRHTRFDQYARGGAIDMWVIPPSGGSS